ncbi:MAG: sigma-70 family RNA polymerase sigma factor, partial [Chloroflexota bacterium]|nr:sigma-70 family RNA polymerase sigma factor [Chloroflexota bacterium]
MPDIAKLWTDFRESKDPLLRERLILHYAPLVRQTIRRLAVSLPPDLEYEDLLSYGIMGLIDALDRFDPERGAGFESYAQMRIKGYVIDALRAMGLVPRSARDKAKEIEKNLAQLRQELGRNPSEQELARKMGVSLEKFHQMLTDASYAIVSLDSPLSFDEDGKPLSLGDTLQDGAAAPSVQAEDKELYEVL